MQASRQRNTHLWRHVQNLAARLPCCKREVVACCGAIYGVHACGEAKVDDHSLAIAAYHNVLQ